jgi:predicted nucleic acid-binding protein
LIVVDSSVLIEFLADRDTPQVARLTHLLQRERLLLGDIVLCEILRGARSEEQAAMMSERLARFMSVEMVGEQVAVRAALHYRVLRRKGITVRNMADTLIATFCIVNRHRLLHNDRDFAPMVQYFGLLEA